MIHGIRSLVSRLIAKFCQRYLANPPTVESNLRSLDIANLELRSDALASVPFLELVRGVVGSVHVKIPWLDLFATPVEISINDVHLVIRPNFAWTPQRAIAFIQQQKQALLEAAEDAMKEEIRATFQQQAQRKRSSSTSSCSDTDADDDTDEDTDDEEGEQGQAPYAALLEAIIENMTLRVSNVHIRLEDDRHTLSNTAFAVGVCLESLSTRSSTSTSTADPTDVMVKSLSAVGLSVYTHCSEVDANEDGEDSNPCHAVSLLASMPLDAFVQRMRTLAQPHRQAVFLRPVNTMLQVRRPKKAALGVDEARLAVSVVVEEISVDTSQQQLACLTALQAAVADFQNKVSQGQRVPLSSIDVSFKPIRRPAQRVSADARAWWRYAASLVRQPIRQRRKEWSFQHMRSFRGDWRTYTALFRDKLQEKSLSFEQNDVLLALEKKWTVDQVLLMRACTRTELRIRMAYETLRRRTDEKRSSLNKLGGYVKSWFSSAVGLSEEVDEIRSPLVRRNSLQRGAVELLRLSTEERTDLFQMVGFDPFAPLSTSAGQPHLEDRSILNADFELRRASVVFEQDSGNDPLFGVMLHGLVVHLEQRVVTLHTSLTLDHVSARDLHTSCNVYPGGRFREVLCRRGELRLAHEQDMAGEELLMEQLHDSLLASTHVHSGNDVQPPDALPPVLELNLAVNLGGARHVALGEHADVLDDVTRGVDLDFAMCMQPLDLVFNWRVITGMQSFLSFPQHDYAVHQPAHAQPLPESGSSRSTQEKVEQLIKTRFRMNLSIDVHAPMVIIPECPQPSSSLSPEQGDSVVVLDLGRLQMRTVDPSQALLTRDESRFPVGEEHLQFYAVHTLDFEGVQVLLLRKRDFTQWHAHLLQPDVHQRLTSSCNFEVDLLHSLLPLDSSLTRTFLRLRVPPVQMFLSSMQRLRVQQLLDSMTPPDVLPSSPCPSKRRHHSLESGVVFTSPRLTPLHTASFRSLEDVHMEAFTLEEEEEEKEEEPPSTKHQQPDDDEFVQVRSRSSSSSSSSSVASSLISEEWTLLDVQCDCSSLEVFLWEDETTELCHLSLEGVLLSHRMTDAFTHSGARLQSLHLVDRTQAVESPSRFMARSFYEPEHVPASPAPLLQLSFTHTQQWSPLYMNVDSRAELCFNMLHVHWNRPTLYRVFQLFSPSSPSPSSAPQAPVAPQEQQQQRHTQGGTDTDEVLQRIRTGRHDTPKTALVGRCTLHVRVCIKLLSMSLNTHLGPTSRWELSDTTLDWRTSRYTQRVVLKLGNLRVLQTVALAREEVVFEKLPTPPSLSDDGDHLVYLALDLPDVDGVSTRTRTPVYDTFMTLRIRPSRFVVLTLFFDEFVDYFRVGFLSTAKRAAREAAQQLLEEQHTSLFQYDVSLHTPLVVVPVPKDAGDVHAREVQLDLGKIHVHNEFFVSSGNADADADSPIDVSWSSDEDIVPTPMQRVSVKSTSLNMCVYPRMMKHRLMEDAGMALTVDSPLCVGPPHLVPPATVVRASVSDINVHFSPAQFSLLVSAWQDVLQPLFTAKDDSIPSLVYEDGGDAPQPRRPRPPPASCTRVLLDMHRFAVHFFDSRRVTIGSRQPSTMLLVATQDLKLEWSDTWCPVDQERNRSKLEVVMGDLMVRDQRVACPSAFRSIVAGWKHADSSGGGEPHHDEEGVSLAFPGRFHVPMESSVSFKPPTVLPNLRLTSTTRGEHHSRTAVVLDAPRIVLLPTSLVALEHYFQQYAAGLEPLSSSSSSVSPEAAVMAQQPREKADDEVFVHIVEPQVWFIDHSPSSSSSSPHTTVPLDMDMATSAHIFPSQPHVDLISSPAVPSFVFSCQALELSSNPIRQPQATVKNTSRVHVDSMQSHICYRTSHLRLPSLSPEPVPLFQPFHVRLTCDSVCVGDALPVYDADVRVSPIDLFFSFHDTTVTSSVFQGFSRAAAAMFPPSASTSATEGDASTREGDEEEHVLDDVFAFLDDFRGSAAFAVDASLGLECECEGMSVTIINDAPGHYVPLLRMSVPDISAVLCSHASVYGHTDDGGNADGDAESVSLALTLCAEMDLFNAEVDAWEPWVERFPFTFKALRQPASSTCLLGVWCEELFNLNWGPSLHRSLVHGIDSFSDHFSMTTAASVDPSDEWLPDEKEEDEKQPDAPALVLHSERSSAMHTSCSSSPHSLSHSPRRHQAHSTRNSLFRIRNLTGSTLRFATPQQSFSPVRHVVLRPGDTLPLELYQFMRGGDRRRQKNASPHVTIELFEGILSDMSVPGDHDHLGGWRRWLPLEGVSLDAKDARQMQVYELIPTFDYTMSTSATPTPTPYHSATIAQPHDERPYLTCVSCHLMADPYSPEGRGKLLDLRSCVLVRNHSVLSMHIRVCVPGESKVVFQSTVAPGGVAPVAVHVLSLGKGTIHFRPVDLENGRSSFEFNDGVVTLGNAPGKDVELCDLGWRAGFFVKCHRSASRVDDTDFWLSVRVTQTTPSSASSDQLVLFTMHLEPPFTFESLLPCPSSLHIAGRSGESDRLLKSTLLCGEQLQWHMSNPFSLLLLKLHVPGYRESWPVVVHRGTDQSPSHPEPHRDTVRRYTVFNDEGLTSRFPVFDSLDRPLCVDVCYERQTVESTHSGEWQLLDSISTRVSLCVEYWLVDRTGLSPFPGLFFASREDAADDKMAAGQLLLRNTSRVSPSGLYDRPLEIDPAPLPFSASLASVLGFRSQPHHVTPVDPSKKLDAISRFHEQRCRSGLLQLALSDDETKEKPWRWPSPFPLSHNAVMFAFPPPQAHHGKHKKLCTRLPDSRWSSALNLEDDATTHAQTITLECTREHPDVGLSPVYDIGVFLAFNSQDLAGVHEDTRVPATTSDNTDTNTDTDTAADGGHELAQPHMASRGVASRLRFHQTKLVILAPRHVLLNATGRTLQYRRVQCNVVDTVGANDEVPVVKFGVEHGDELCFRFREYGSQWTGPVRASQVGRVWTRLRNEYTKEVCVVQIDCDLVNATFHLRVILTHVESANAVMPPQVANNDLHSPYRVENCTFETIQFHQTRAAFAAVVLHPYASAVYAWDMPTGKHLLVLHALTIAGSVEVGVFPLQRLGTRDVVEVKGLSFPVVVELLSDGAVRVLRISSLHRAQVLGQGRVQSTLPMSMPVVPPVSATVGSSTPTPTFSSSTPGGVDGSPPLPPPPMSMSMPPLLKCLIRVRLAGVSVSLVNLPSPVSNSGPSSKCTTRPPTETMLLTIARMELDVRHSLSEIRCDARVGHVQLDHQHPRALFPVVLCPIRCAVIAQQQPRVAWRTTHVGQWLDASSHTQDTIPFFHLFVAKNHTNSTKDLLFLPHVSVNTEPLQVNLSYMFLLEVAKLFNAMFPEDVDDDDMHLPSAIDVPSVTASAHRRANSVSHLPPYSRVPSVASMDTFSVTPPSEPQSHPPTPPHHHRTGHFYAGQRLESPTPTPTPTGDHTPTPTRVFNLYVQTMVLHNFSCRISFTNAPGQSNSGEEDNAGPVWMLVEAAARSIMNVEDAPLYLSALELTDVFATPEQLVADMIRHYRYQAMRSTASVLGSVSVLGSPVALFTSLTAGVSDLLYEPFAGLAQSVSDSSVNPLARGVFRGVSSLVRNSLFGVSNTVGRMSTSFSQGLSSMVTRDSLGPHGMPLGVLQGVLHGVRGLAQEPVVGMRRSGVGGAARGLMRGAAGFFLLPTIGLLNLTTASADHVKSAVTFKHQTRRMRCPRLFLLSFAPPLPTSSRRAHVWLLTRQTHFPEYMAQWVDEYLHSVVSDFFVYSIAPPVSLPRHNMTSVVVLTMRRLFHLRFERGEVADEDSTDDHEEVQDETLTVIDSWSTEHIESVKYDSYSNTLSIRVHASPTARQHRTSRVSGRPVKIAVPSEHSLDQSAKRLALAFTHVVSPQRHRS